MHWREDFSRPHHSQQKYELILFQTSIQLPRWCMSRMHSGVFRLPSPKLPWLNTLPTPAVAACITGSESHTGLPPPVPQPLAPRWRHLPAHSNSRSLRWWETVLLALANTVVYGREFIFCTPATTVHISRTQTQRGSGAQKALAWCFTVSKILMFSLFGEEEKTWIEFLFFSLSLSLLLWKFYLVTFSPLINEYFGEACQHSSAYWPKQITVVNKTNKIFL